MIVGADKTVALRHYLNDLGIDLRGSDYHPPHIAEATVQALVDGYTLDQAKAWWIAEVYRTADAKRAVVLAGTSDLERASWPVKDREAAAYVDEATAEVLCPTLYREAVGCGATTATIRDRVLANAAAYKQYEGTIAGHARLLRDQITACQSFAAIEAIDITSGWHV